MRITQFTLFIAILNISNSFKKDLNCENATNKPKFIFHLIKTFHRSQADVLYLANVHSLESCKELGITQKALALNYSPKERVLEKEVCSLKTNRDHYLKQPELYFNCHVLRCPENSTFKTLVNDSQFDYYSLYDRPIALTNYICIPQVGIFVFNDIPATFQNASLNCQSIGDNHCGSLAHIISSERTLSLRQALIDYNDKQSELRIHKQIHSAYIGLYFNRTQLQQQRLEFVNTQGNKLQCFDYRAWAPGNPKTSTQHRNSSCVALTSHGTWRTVECKRKLPYICEIYTKCAGEFID